MRRSPRSAIMAPTSWSVHARRSAASPSSVRLKRDVLRCGWIARRSALRRRAVGDLQRRGDAAGEGRCAAGGLCGVEVDGDHVAVVALVPDDDDVTAVDEAERVGRRFEDECGEAVDGRAAQDAGRLLLLKAPAALNRDRARSGWERERSVGLWLTGAWSALAGAPAQ